MTNYDGWTNQEIYFGLVMSYIGAVCALVRDGVHDFGGTCKYGNVNRKVEMLEFIFPLLDMLSECYSK